MLRRTHIISSSNTTSHLHKSVLGRWRGKPYANNANAVASEEAEAEAEIPNHRNGRRRVKGRRLPKAERQAMLESFVTKYRQINAGAFPSVSHAQEQLGGSYYIVKSILQELKYRDKMSPSRPAIEENSTRELSADAGVLNDSEAIYDADLPEQEQVREIESLTQVEEKATCEEVLADVGVLNNYESAYDAGLPEQEEVGEIECLTQVEEIECLTQVGEIECLTQIDCLTQDLGDLGKDIEEAKQHLSDSISTGSQLLEESFEVVSHPCEKSEKSETEEAQADKHDFVAKEKDLPIAETNRASPPSVAGTEDKKKQEQALEDVPGDDDSKCKTEKYEEIPQPDKISKDISGREADDAEPSRKSTLWGSMKSFANDIINIFRKP